MSPTQVANYDATHVCDLLEQIGEPAYRTTQVLEWIWSKGVSSYDEMTNVPLHIREALAQQLPLLRPRLVERQVSRDGTRKYLVAFSDGEGVEVVGLPTADRLTVCASTQVGCAMGCVFCATGQGGFVRNMTASEIAETVALVAQDFDRRVSNVVLMGQGEPLANYDASLEALRIVNARWGFDIGARHLTISTAGLIDGIERLATEPEQFTLAVSLHSAKQKTRDALMPALATNPLPALRDALIAYYEKTGRRPSLEYTLIAGRSDTPSEIEALGLFASAIGAHINLIPLNPLGADGDGSLTSQLRPSPDHRATEIATLLRNRYGVEATVRTRRGADIDGACGQLRQRKQRDPGLVEAQG